MCPAGTAIPLISSDGELRAESGEQGRARYAEDQAGDNVDAVGKAETAETTAASAQKGQRCQGAEANLDIEVTVTQT